MSDYPAWMQRHSDELARAAEMGFTKWRFDVDDLAASRVAFSIRNGEGYVDQLMLFRRMPETCLGFRHGVGGPAWWTQPNAIAAGALSASRRTGLAPLVVVLSEVADWPVDE
jgi:hypothetical protein